MKSQLTKHRKMLAPKRMTYRGAVKSRKPVKPPNDRWLACDSCPVTQP